MTSPVALICTSSRRILARDGTHQESENCPALAERARHGPPDLIRTSIRDKSSGSTKSTTHLDHISHCKNSIWYKFVEKMDLPSTCYQYSPRFDPSCLLSAQPPAPTQPPATHGGSKGITTRNVLVPNGLCGGTSAEPYSGRAPMQVCVSFEAHIGFRLKYTPGIWPKHRRI